MGLFSGEFLAVVTLGNLGRPAAFRVSRHKFENSVFVHVYLLMVCPDTEPSRQRPAGQTIKQLIRPISFDYDLSSDSVVFNSFCRNLFDVPL